MFKKKPAIPPREFTIDLISRSDPLRSHHFLASSFVQSLARQSEEDLSEWARVYGDELWSPDGAFNWLKSVLHESEEVDLVLAKTGDFFYGWACAEPMDGDTNLLLFAYVKCNYRRQGMGEMLLGALQKKGSCTSTRWKLAAPTRAGRLWKPKKQELTIE